MKGTKKAVPKAAGVVCDNKPYWFILLVVVSLLLFYSAYDKQSKTLVLEKLVKIFSFQDVTYSIHEFNKVAGLAAIGLISISFILGPLSKLFSSVFEKYLYFRKPVGVVGFWVALAHGAYSLVEFYKLDVNLMFFANPKAYGLAAGILSLFVFFVMTATSAKPVMERLGYENWKKLQTAGYLGLVLAVVHFFILETKPNIGMDVRPYGLLFFYLAIAALALRALLIFIKTKPRASYEEHVGAKAK